MPKRKVKLIEVEVTDWTMAGGKYDSSYHGNVTKDKDGCFTYCNSDGKMQWGISEEIVNMIIGKGVGKIEVVEKDEVMLPPLPQVAPVNVSLIDIIGAKPRRLNIEFGE